MSRALAVALLAAAPGLLAQETGRREGWVVLPVEEYKSLRALAYPLEPEPTPPPLAATVTRVDYDLKVMGETASGQARLTIDVFKEGWAKIPMPADLRVREARLEGRAVSLVEGPGPRAGSPYVLLSRTGRSVLVLDVAVPVSQNAGTEALSLPGAGAAVSRVVLVAPRRGIDVSVTGGLVDAKSETADGTRLVAYGRPGEALQFSWRPQLEAKKSALPLRLRDHVTEMVGLGEEMAQLSAEVEVQVAQGAATNVTIALPDGVAVTQVSGRLVGDWVARGAELRVNFLEPVERDTSLVIVAEAHVPREGRILIPLVRLPLAERETGGVAVEVLGEGEMKSRQMSGMQDADPSDLGGAAAGKDSPSLVAFKYHALSGHDPRELAVEISRYAAQAVSPIHVDEARYRALLSEEGKTLVQAQWAVRNNQRAFLGVTLPPGAELWSAAVGGRPVRPGHTAEGGLLIPLAKSRTGGEAAPFLAEVVYLQRGAAWAPRGSVALQLPVVDVEVSQTGLELEYSPRFRVDPKLGAFQTQPFAPPLSPAFRAPAPVLGIGPMTKGGPELDEKTAKDLDVMMKEMEKGGRGKRITGVIPIEISFPHYGSAAGPQLFLVSELTAQGAAPGLELAYKRAVK